MGKYLRSFLLLGLATFVMLVGETSALAQRGYYGRGYRPRPRYNVPYYGGHTHQGFYMRLDVGLGYLSASETYAGATDEYSGAGVSYGVAFGGAIVPNLILFGELFATTAINADVRVPGYAVAPTGWDLTMWGIGPGVAYYVQPINLYLSGSLAFSQITFSDTDTGVEIDDTDIGVGLNFMLGKEWWVTPDWGLGLAGQLHVARMDSQGTGYNARMKAVAFALIFSATYN